MFNTILVAKYREILLHSAERGSWVVKALDLSFCGFRFIMKKYVVYKYVNRFGKKVIDVESRIICIRLKLLQWHSKATCIYWMKYRIGKLS